MARAQRSLLISGPSACCAGRVLRRGACPTALSSHVLVYTGERQLLSETELCKQCRLLVPFLFGEANPNPNLKPTWLAIIAGRARPDEPEVVGGVQEEGW